MKILFLSTLLPCNEQTGSEIASNAFIKALRSAGHDVTVLAYQRKGDVIETGDGYFSVGDRYIETSHSKFYPLIWMITSIIKSMPYSAGKYYSKAYTNKVKEFLENDKYDLAVIDHGQLGWLTDYLPGNMEFIFIAHNIEFDIYKEQSDQKNPPMNWIYQREARLMRYMENGLAVNAKMTWVLTDADFKYFSNVRGRAGVKEFGLPSKFTVMGTKSAEKKYDICMLGSWTWKSNMDGLKWFFDEVYRLLPEMIKIRVAGKGADFLSDSYPNVEYCGYVEYAYDFIIQSRVIAVPSVSGGGMQIKTLDAVSTGIPVVATSFAMRGIDDFPSSVRVADSPEGFAASLVEAVWMVDDEGISDEAHHWAEKRRNSFFSSIASSIKMIEEGADIES